MQSIFNALNECRDVLCVGKEREGGPESVKLDFRVLREVVLRPNPAFNLCVAL